MHASGHFVPEEGFLYIPANINLNNLGVPRGEGYPMYGKQVIVCIDVRVSGNRDHLGCVQRFIRFFLRISYQVSPPVWCPVKHYNVSDQLVMVIQYEFNNYIQNGWGISYYNTPKSVAMPKFKRYYIMEAQKQWNMICW